MHFLSGALTCYILHAKSCIACHWSQYFLILNANVKCVGCWKWIPFILIRLTKFPDFFWTIPTKPFIRKRQQLTCYPSLQASSAGWSPQMNWCQGWLICDPVALLGCLFLIFTLFAVRLPSSLFAPHFKAYCPFLKTSPSFLYYDAFHSLSNLALINVLSGKDHVCMVASKFWGLDRLCFSAEQSSTGAKRRNGS